MPQALYARILLRVATSRTQRNRHRWQYTLTMTDSQQLPSLQPDTVRAALGSYEPEFIDDESLMPSAVLIPLIEGTDGPSILFTVRTSRVEHHKGEVSFPGGARDPEDESIERTAIRETHEEVGIEPDKVEVLGRLNDHQTRTGYHITPLVGIIRPGAGYDHDQFEVNEIFEVSFADLWETYLNGRQPFKYGENTIMAYEFHHDGYRIWGATAGILAEFFDVLRAAG